VDVCVALDELVQENQAQAAVCNGNGCADPEKYAELQSKWIASMCAVGATCIEDVFADTPNATKQLISTNCDFHDHCGETLFIDVNVAVYGWATPNTTVSNATIRAFFVDNAATLCGDADCNAAFHGFLEIMLNPSSGISTTAYNAEEIMISVCDDPSSWGDAGDAGDSGDSDDAFVDIEAALQGLEDVSTGVIIGAVIGGICGCALLIALPIAIFVCCCSAAAKNKRGAAASQKTPPQQVVVVHGDAVTMESKA
jgi:hypothetical protein